MKEGSDDSMARFRNFYPELSDKEWEEAQQHLKAYFLIAERIASDEVRKRHAVEDIEQLNQDGGDQS